MKKALSHEFLCDSAFLVHRPGLVEHLLYLCGQQGVGLIVTVDNGIAAVAEAELCKELGIDRTLECVVECVCTECK